MRRKRKMASKKRRETAAQRAERLHVHRERMRKFREELRIKQRESQECNTPDQQEAAVPSPLQPFHPMYGTLENDIINEYCEKQEITQKSPEEQEVVDKIANGHLLSEPSQQTRSGRIIRIRKAAFGETENSTKEEERLTALRNRRAARRANETKEEGDSRRQKQRERMRAYRNQRRQASVAINDRTSMAPETANDEMTTVPPTEPTSITNILLPVIDSLAVTPKMLKTYVNKVREKANHWNTPETETDTVKSSPKAEIPQSAPVRVAISLPQKPVSESDHSVLEPDVILQEKGTAVNIPLKICYTTMTVKQKHNGYGAQQYNSTAKLGPKAKPRQQQQRKPFVKKSPIKNSIPPEPDITLLETSDGSLVPLAVVQQTHEDFDDMIEIEMEFGMLDKQTQTTIDLGDTDIKYLLEENQRLKEEIETLKREIEFGQCSSSF